MKLVEIMAVRDELYKAREETCDQLCDYDTKVKCTKKPEGFVEGEQTVDIKFLRRMNFAMFNALNLLDKIDISGVTFKEGK